MSLIPMLSELYEGEEKLQDKWWSAHGINMQVGQEFGVHWEQW